jgi:hypothetical protein
VHAGPGFGPSGELIRIARTADGSIRSIGAPMTSWPIAEFRRTRTALTRHRAAGASLG